MRKVDQICVRLHFELVLSIALSDFELLLDFLAVFFISVILDLTNAKHKYKTENEGTAQPGGGESTKSKS